jgi:hypothetical protein
MTNDKHPAPRGKVQAPPRTVINKDLVINIVLDLPLESDDKFEIIGGSGKYKETLGAAKAEELNPSVKGEKVLRFKVKPDNKGYKLVHHRANGVKRTIFLETRLQDMTEAGHKPETARYSYAHLPSQVRTKLPDRYGTDRDVDKDLMLVDLKVEDPEL